MLTFDITKVEVLTSHLVMKGLHTETVYTVRMDSGYSFDISEETAKKVRKYLNSKAGEEYGSEETGNV